MRGAAKSEKTGERSAQTIKIVLKSVEADRRARDIATDATHDSNRGLVTF